MPSILHPILFLLLLLTAASHAACSNNATPPAAPLSEHCETATTRCRLPGGALGVCLYDTESNLKCMSQH